MIIGNLFGHVNLLEKSLDNAWLKQQVIAQNIANQDTPNYKSERVDFKTRFRSAIYREDSFKNFITRDKHISFEEPDPLSVQSAVVKNTHYTMRMDGNNVDIDQEMVELAKNTIEYQTLVSKLVKEFGRIRIAITEGR